MKKSYVIGTIIAIVLAALYLGSAVTRDQGLGGGFSVGSRFFLTPNVGGTTQAGEPTATTTRLYMSSTASASSTLIAFLERGEQLDTNILMEASTTASTLAWSNQFSYDGITYYNEDCSTFTSNTVITHGATPCINYWTPGTTATTTLNVTVKNTGARYMRIRFGMTGANGALHVFASPKEPNP